MSLVQMKPQRRPMPLDLERAVPEGDQSQAPDITTFMARVFGDPPAEARETEGAASPPRTFEVAFDVLKRGAEALGELQDRCDHLQSELASLSERSRLELETSESARTEWQQLATAMKEKLNETQTRLDEMNRFAETATSRADAATARAEAAERRASTMEKVAIALHDDILAAFGGFTRARSVWQEENQAARPVSG